jgi:hypothetical protein
MQSESEASRRVLLRCAVSRLRADEDTCSAAEHGDICDPAATAFAAAAAAAQAAAVEAARLELETRLALSTSPLPPHRNSASKAASPGAPAAGVPPRLDSEDSSAGFSTEGLSDGGSVLPAPRSALSPRAARHPAARRREADGEGDGGAAAATASKQRQLLQLQRRRKRELEKLVLHGTPAEAEHARAELPNVQASLSRRATPVPTPMYLCALALC